MNCLHPLKIKYWQYRYIISEKQIDILKSNYRLKSKLDNIYTNGHQDIYVDESGLTKTSKYILADCGYCYGCRTKKANEWSLRVAQQVFIDRLENKNAAFITLTYNDENLNPEGVQKKDIELFFKRLRKHLTPLKCEVSADSKITKKYLNSLRYKLKLLPEKDKFKYFLCAEYGTIRGRAHYHFIMTGFKNSITRIKKLVDIVWSKGFTQTHSCTSATINYVSRYMVKDYDMILKPEEYINKKGREYPFRLVSKSFGKQYMIKYLSDVLEYKHYIHAGIKFSVPRTYQRWIRQIIGSDKFYEYFTKSFNDHKIANILSICAEVNYDISQFKDTYIFEEDLYAIINHNELYAFYLNKLKDDEFIAIQKHKAYCQAKYAKNYAKLHKIKEIA